MRRFALPLAILAAVTFAAFPAAAASSKPAHDEEAGEESQAVAKATDWFTSQRFAPNGAVNPNAYAAAAAQAAALPTVPATWTERTNLAGADGVDFSDSPQVHRPHEREQQLGGR